MLLHSHWLLLPFLLCEKLLFLHWFLLFYLIHYFLVPLLLGVAHSYRCNLLHFVHDYLLGIFHTLHTLHLLLYILFHIAHILHLLNLVLCCFLNHRLNLYILLLTNNYSRYSSCLLFLWLVLNFQLLLSFLFLLIAFVYYLLVYLMYYLDRYSFLFGQKNIHHLPHLRY